MCWDKKSKTSRFFGKREVFQLLESDDSGQRQKNSEGMKMQKNFGIPNFYWTGSGAGAIIGLTLKNKVPGVADTSAVPDMI